MKKKTFKSGTDAVLLFEHIKKYRSEKPLEFGCGEGMISSMYAELYPETQLTAIDINQHYTDKFIQYLQTNNLKNISVICGDILEFSIKTKSKFDLIFFNPPYYSVKEGKISEDTFSLISKHQVLCSEDDFLISARRLLEDNGRFCFIYPSFKIKTPLLDKIKNSGFINSNVHCTINRRFKILELF